MAQVLRQILARYVEVLAGSWPWTTGLFVLGAAVAWAAGRGPRPGRRRPGVYRAVVAAAVLAGLGSAVVRASLVDDAFISFRYARNLALGRGLVYNVGDRVEGYTNFLWTVLIAGIYRLTPLDAPVIALALSLAAFVATLVVAYRLGVLLTEQGKGTARVPVAVLLLVANSAFTEFATTGMETMAASLLVTLGAYNLVRRDDARGAGQAGAFFAAATLTRPDHALFYAAAGIALGASVAAPSVAAARQGVGAVWRVAGSRMAAFVAPVAGLAAYLAWKVAYYGSIVPNTFYAKSVQHAYWRQGAAYAALFYLGNHFWVPTLLFLLWLGMPAAEPRARVFRRFAAASFVLWNLYVLWVGGDFMDGRFYVSLLPLVLLGAETCFHSLDRTRGLRWTRWVAAGLLAASATGTTLLGPSKIRWNVADEGSWYPVRPRDLAWRRGPDPYAAFVRFLAERGGAPLVATPNIGRFGYDVDVPLLDTQGLTDSRIAREPLARRGRPGHERITTVEDMIRRGVLLSAGEKFTDVDRRRVDRLRIGEHVLTILVYDRGVMTDLRARVPDATFVDFEGYLDRYIAELPSKDPRTVATDLEWFRSYYFDRNADPARLRALEKAARW